jgi:hypothetical protein
VGVGYKRRVVLKDLMQQNNVWEEVKMVLEELYEATANWSLLNSEHQGL